MWSARGAATGAPRDHSMGTLAWCMGTAFFVCWRALGFLAWPFLLAHPRARQHMLGLHAPVPGWTWLHGASAGEHTAARALSALVPDCWRTSSSWRTPVAGAFPAPLDLPFLVGRWIDRARPCRLVLVEAELWPGWIVASRNRGIPVVVVNARAGRGTSRWRKIPPLWRWLTAGVRFIDQADTGDLKLSATVRAASIALGRDAIVGGSTRPGDESALLDAWASLPEPRPLLVLAPRHSQRFEAVAELLEHSGHSWFRRSDGGEGEGDILLLDTIGELAGLYGQVRAAFVGGTFDPAIGGHSPAEAFAAGVPVIHGPQISANPVAWTQGIAVRAATPAQLHGALRAALSMGVRPSPIDESAARCAAMLPAGRTPPATWARPWLLPLAVLWRRVARTRSETALPSPVPTVLVGGLSWGGAGRTPAVAWLASQVPGSWVVSRGYRRSRVGPALRIGLPDQTPAHDLGDELEMLRRRGIPVISCPDRSAGIAEAARLGAQLVLVDGGIGNPGIRRDLSLMCIDGDWPRGRGPAPVGTARLPWAAVHAAQALWVRGPLPEDLPDVPTVQLQMQPHSWLRQGESLPLDAHSGPVHAAAGIARPERFVCTLMQLGLQISSLSLSRDHGELRALPPGCVVTEKDAARLPPSADIWALRVEPKLTGEQALIDLISALLK
jgi:3-deoxy-D-manno-octulosonic-acid transferase